MIHLFSLFLATLLTILSSINASNYTCDYSLGDQNWDFAKVFYDEEVTIPEGHKHWNFVLPKKDSQMISFICINITSVDKGTAEVYFSSIFHTLKITLAKDAPKDGVPVKILAKSHGY